MKKNLSSKVEYFLSPVYGRHVLGVYKNILKRLVCKQPKEHKFLFILSPPHCGSTLINQIISTSKFVSVNNVYGPREGQLLPTVREMMFNHKGRWDTSIDFDWSFIKKEWMKYWDLTRPVLLEKSTPNILRAKSIKEAFHPAFFVILYRNPYAHCESLIRRKKMNSMNAAIFAIKCLKNQKSNIEQLDNSIHFSYEELTTKSTQTANRISDLIPELDDIRTNKKFTAHNHLNKKKMKIMDLNQGKLDKLNPSQIEEINSIFTKERNLLSFFDYDLIE